MALTKEEQAKRREEGKRKGMDEESSTFVWTHVPFKRKQLGQWTGVAYRLQPYSNAVYVLFRGIC